MHKLPFLGPWFFYFFQHIIWFFQHISRQHNSYNDTLGRTDVACAHKCPRLYLSAPWPDTVSQLHPFILLILYVELPIYRLAGTYITLLGYPGCASKHERKSENIEIKIISLYLLIFYAHPPLLLPFHPQHSLILYCSDIASFKALQYVLIALLCCWNKTKTIGKFFYLLPVFSIIVKIISHTWMTNKFFWDPIIHFFQYFGGCEKHMVTK